MAHTNIYVVEYCEIENGNIIDRGVCNEAFLDEKDAINKMYEISDDKMNELLEEYSEDDIYRESFSSLYLVIVHSPIGIYEYSISRCSHI